MKAIKDNALEYALTAVQEAINDAANDRITYWLSKLSDEQLLWFVYVSKRLASLSEGIYMRRAFNSNQRKDDEQ